MKKINIVQILRITVLSILLIFISIIVFQHKKVVGGPKGWPFIHSICPFGGLETIYKFIAEGSFLKRTNVSNLSS